MAPAAPSVWHPSGLVGLERGGAAKLRAMASPFRTAEAFGVEEVIDPRETRPLLCRFLDAVQGRIAHDLGPKRRLGVRP